MGKIKKLKDVELVGGTEQSDVYPITSIKAIYDESNKRLDNIIAELQKSTDSSLETENKTIVGSINELKRLRDKGYLFKGVATPDTNPGVVKQKVFYIANGKGTYEKFGGINVDEDEVVLLTFDETWKKLPSGIASQCKLTELKEKVDALALGAFYGYFPDSSSLPVDVTTPGYAYVGLDNPYKIWNFNGESWSDSGTSIDMDDADEEDITRNADGKLQFKDRAYGDGMGCVILRKSKTFIEQVTQANTIYEIRYDFDLNNKEITIPKNSILEFKGGSLHNGTIVFDGTVINADLYQIFYNVITKGYSPSDCQVEWFGAKAYNKSDTEFTYSSDGIQQAIDSCFKNIFFNIGVYYLDKTLEVDFRKSLNFKGSYNGPIKDVYDYPTNNINASTLCVLTDIDILHINCRYEKVPNDVWGFITIKGYGILDATKVDKYNSVAVKINVDGVQVVDSIIDLCIVKKPIYVSNVEEAKKEDFGNSIGIELNNSSTYPYSIYGLTINGFIKNFRYGIRNNIPVACFPTAVTFNCQINRCVTAIDFGESGIMGSQVFGEIQSGTFFTEETKYKYPLFIGNVNKVYFDCYVWDLDLIDSKNIYTNAVVLNLTQNSSPIFGEMFKTFLPYVRGDANSIYNEYKRTDFLCANSTFKPFSTYFIDFLTDDYAFHQDYTIEKNGINIDGSPFNYGNGLYIRPTEVDNGKSFKIVLNVDKGLTKLFIEYNRYNTLSYFDSVDIIYYNEKNAQLSTKNYRFNREEGVFYIYDLNTRWGSSLHHVEIIFNNLTYVSKDILRFFIKASGFRHNYHHINTPNRTVINKDGTFILQGDEYRNISTESESYLLNVSNRGKIYSTAGRERYFSVSDILNAIHQNESAYGNGCRFYMYNYDEPKTFIYDKTVDKLYRINMIDSDFKERGVFTERPHNPYIGYQFFCTDKQTQEGATDGIVIYYKGNNVWVDALGRVVS